MRAVHPARTGKIQWIAVLVLAYGNHARDDAGSVVGHGHTHQVFSAPHGHAHIAHGVRQQKYVEIVPHQHGFGLRRYAFVRVKQNLHHVFKAIVAGNPGRQLVRMKVKAVIRLRQVRGYVVDHRGRRDVFRFIGRVEHIALEVVKDMRGLCGHGPGLCVLFHGFNSEKLFPRLRQLNHALVLRLI